MRQSTIIFGTLIFAFIVFITVKGQLPAYFDLFKAKPPETKTVSGSDHIANATKSVGDVAKVAATLAKIAAFF